jgi:glutathione synthase/RimK-type ligase-like ATP-grasp enzyme
MKRLIILTDEESNFLISIPDLVNYTSMDTNKIKSYFSSHGFIVRICKFSELDLGKNFRGIYVLYQTSEGPGSFYKRYIEDLVYTLEKQGAILLPCYELLKAHHNKVYMEMLRSKFSEASLKSIKSTCYGSWVDAGNYNSGFPVVIKKASSSGGAGVFLANNRKEYLRNIKKAGKILIAESITGLLINNLKTGTKKLVKYFQPSKSGFLKYNTEPLSTTLVVQTFKPGLSGDFKVLIYGDKYYTLYRKNRDNDFRASGSGKLFEVRPEDQIGLLNFAKRITKELDFPIIGMDIAFDGKEYHLFEFQVIHLGTPPLHRSNFWHQFHDGKWVKYEGKSILEEVFSQAIVDFITRKERINIKKNHFIWKNLIINKIKHNETTHYIN